MTTVKVGGVDVDPSDPCALWQALYAVGFDADEIFEERLAEHRRYQAAGMMSPYDRDVRSPDIPEDPYRAGGQGQ